MIGDWFYLMPLELAVAALLFCAHVDWRRDRYVRGAVLLAAQLLLFALVYPPMIRRLNLVDSTSLPWLAAMTAYFGLCAASLIVVLHDAARVSWMESLVIVAAGYSVQHIAFDAFRLMLYCPWAVRFRDDPWWNLLGEVVAFAAVYALAYLCFARRLTIDGEKVHSRIQWVAGCVGILVFVIEFNLLFVQHKSDDVQVVGYLYSMVCVLLALSCLMLVATNDRLYGDLAMMRQTDRLKEEHYEIAKETIELINIKCHDIRKSFASLYAGEGARPSDESIREVENSIRIYDAMFHTGNDSLDVLLNEKSLYCSSNGIMLTCVADGRRLGFMDRADLYALFGNMLDNAVESAGRVPDPAKRVINVSVAVNDRLVVIKEDNYYAPDRVPAFRDGLPLTTKGDARHHGFGMRSIAWQVRKYGGELTVDARDEVFSLTIVLPLPV